MERHDEKKTTARVMTNKSRSSWGSRIWKQCSPLQLLRFIRDSYVTGCISAADSAPLNAVAKHAGIFHASDHVDAHSRQSSRRDDVEPYSIEALSRQSSRNEATQQWRRQQQQQQKPITLNLLIADQVQFLRHNFFLSQDLQHQIRETIEYRSHCSRGLLEVLCSLQGFRSRLPPEERASRQCRSQMNSRVAEENSPPATPRRSRGISSEQLRQCSSAALSSLLDPRPTSDQ